MDREIAFSLRKFDRISGNFDTRSLIPARYILSRALAKSVFFPYITLSRQRAVNTLYPIIPHWREGDAWRFTKRGVGEEMREEVSLALSGMSSRDYVSQDSINLSTSSLFKGGGDFPSRRCLDEWLVKIRIRFLLFLLLCVRPRARRAPSPSFVFAFHSVAPGKHSWLPMTRPHPLEIGRFRWRERA